MALTGIITFHNVPNFGAFIQAWSLVQAVGRLGRPVEVIDYRADGHQKKFRRKSLRRFMPSLGQWRMNRFMRANLPLSRIVRTPEEVDSLIDSGRYDRLICGSDQVWLVDGTIPFDRTYFLGVGSDSGVRKISYAPSCGSITSYGEHGTRIGELVQSIDYRSVRDLYSLDLIRSLGVSDVAHVVDPSLLADFTPLIGRRPYRKPYLAVVGGMTPGAERLAKKIASRRRLDIVAVGTRCSVANREKRFVNAGEWVSWISHSAGVLTSLFHGAAVSTSLRKPFLAIDASGRAFKLRDLLERFQLTRLFACSEDGEYSADDSFLDHNFAHEEGVISREVDSSWKYLREALNG